jgi:hypothetical protein
MTVRDELLRELRAVVGPDRDVHIVPYQDNLDVPDRPTIMFKQQTLAPLREGPRAGLRVDYVLTFIASDIDPTAAETFLDQWVPETLADLHMSWFAWTEATKVVFGLINPAYDVACYVIARPTNVTPAPAGDDSQEGQQ